MSHHISCLSLGLGVLISRPEVTIFLFALCPFISVNCPLFILPPSTLFTPSVILPLALHPPPLFSLGVWEGMLQCRMDLTKQKSSLWLCSTIYKWLVINPRPTLMSSQIFSDFSLTHLHAQGCFAYRHMLTDVNGNWWGGMPLSTNSCNLITSKGQDNTTYCTHIHKVIDKFTSQCQTSWPSVSSTCRPIRADFIFAQATAFRHYCSRLSVGVTLMQWKIKHPPKTNSFSVCFLYLPIYFMK